MTQITQIFNHLELFSEGDPPRHTLFLLGQVQGAPDQLLLIDPPPDAGTRFRLAEQTAVLFTVPGQDAGLPQVEVQAGGVTHIRVGKHLLDVYTDSHGSVVHLPAVGVVCGGQFGSDLSLPQLAPDDDGQAALGTLRLLARLLKEQRIQLYIPHTGSLIRDRTEAMRRLAEDVSYLHGLRRGVPAAAQRGADLAAVQQMAASLLPGDRQAPLCRQIHEQNVAILHGQAKRLP